MKQRYHFHLLVQGITMALLATFLLVSGNRNAPSSVAGAQGGPDVGFRSVTGPPFDASDIWVDSQINGFGTYFADVGPSGTPRGSGDPLVAFHVNRVYARVHNFGTKSGRNLTMNFYVRQPAGIGDGGYWQLIGTVTDFGPIRPGRSRDGFVQWTPQFGGPTSIKVEIEPLNGETSTANNAVIEGSAFFAAYRMPAGLPEFDFLVHNPSEDSSVNLFFEAVVTPQGQAESELAAWQSMGWQVQIIPEFRHLRAGNDCLIHVSLTAPDPCENDDGAPAEISIIGSYNLRGDPDSAPMPFGGATIFARSTREAAVEITCPDESTSPGQRIRLTGQLLGRDCPPNDLSLMPLAAINQPIGLEYRSPSAQVTTFIAHTNSQGVFFHSFTPSEPGVWTVLADWVGDGVHPAAEGSCSFDVVGCPSPELETIPDPIDVRFGTTKDVPLSVMNAEASCEYAFSISPALGFVTLVDNGDGTATLRLAPQRADIGSYRLTIMVNDNSSPPHSDSQTITINVTP